MVRYHLTVNFHNVETDAFDSNNYYYWIDTDKNITVGGDTEDVKALLYGKKGGK